MLSENALNLENHSGQNGNPGNPKKFLNGLFEVICQKHNRHLEKYCAFHDKIICKSCVSTQHATCSNIVNIRDASRDMKPSADVDAICETIESLFQNVKNLKEERENVLKDFKEQHDSIKEKVAIFREIINSHLDEIEQELLRDLSKQCRTHKKNIDHFVKECTEIENKLQILDEKTKKINDLPNEVQTFINVYNIRKSVNKISQKLSADFGILESYQIDIEINPKLVSFPNYVDNYGKVCIDISKRDSPFLTQRIEQNEKESDSNFLQVTLKPICTINVRRCGLMKITDCMILPSSQVLIADYYGKNELKLFTENGEYSRSIPLCAPPFGMALVGSCQVAVSLGSKRCIEIVEINSNESLRKINTPKHCWGIAYYDNFILTISDSKVHVFDNNGETFKIIETGTRDFHNLIVTTEQLILSSQDLNCVKSFNMAGDELWEFKEETLKGPIGLSFYGDEGIFVVGASSYNLVLISRDGKKSKTLLSENDGICCPQCVRYNPALGHLVVCNSARKGFIYKVN